MLVCNRISDQNDAMSQSNNIDTIDIVDELKETEGSFSISGATQ